MSRNEEYAALRDSLAEPPPQLAYTVTRALNRKKVSRRRVRILGVPAGSLAVCFVAFMLLVNLFPPFARACGGVPVLRELAKAVAWSPSLSAAVDNEYVQPVGQEQSKNGITAKVEYLIVDQKQLNVFYTLDTDQYGQLDADGAVTLLDGNDGYSGSNSSYGTPNGVLRQLSVNFVDRDIQDGLTLTLKVYESGYDENGIALEPAEETMEDAYFEVHTHDPEILAAFTFDLTFDPWFTAQGETVAVGKTFQLDGQTLTLKQAEIYPTHLRLDFGYDPNNTAWLTGLDFYVENERGEQFKPVTNGISSTGEESSPSMVTYWMDTTYFSDSKDLNLYITQARWLEKDREKIWLNLVTKEHDPLPDGAELAGIQHLDGGYLLTFQAKQLQKGCREERHKEIYQEVHMYSLWNGYLDADGTELRFSSTGSSCTYQDPDTGEYLDGSVSGFFYETVPLPDYQGTEVWLKPGFTRVTDFSNPAAVSIR
ncbi:hypothetical protein OBV_22140 [Oscillibacter valericigenes Sjm18-20]|nr:hypothetical protein OBV_22140 [Oscillibacter valericigenes Sjm18-20]